MTPPLPGNRAECHTCELLLNAGWQAGEEYALQNAILQHSPLAIIATDLMGTIIYFNPAAQKMLGYRWEEVVGRHSPTLFHLEHELRRHARTPETRGFEVFIEQLAETGQD